MLTIVNMRPAMASTIVDAHPQTKVNMFRSVDWILVSLFILFDHGAVFHSAYRLMEFNAGNRPKQIYR